MRGKHTDDDTRDLSSQYTAVETAVGAPDLDELAPGTPLGAYTLAAKIAAGGGGTVYRAEDAAGRPVAIEIMLRELAASPQALMRFQREASLGRAFTTDAPTP